MNKVVPISYAVYHVGMKILLKKGNEYLFLIDTIYNLYDLPGGRIDSNEYNTPLTEVIT
jgi:hypothetical protein